MVNHDYWSLQHSHTKLGLVSFWIWISAVSLMCSYQVLQRPLQVKHSRLTVNEKRGSNEPPQGKGGVTPPTNVV